MGESTMHDWVERIEQWIAIALQVAIAGLTVGAIWRQQWLLAFSGLLVLALTFTPAIIEKHMRTQLPVEFSLVTCIFLYASFGLGEASGFYTRFWWWDLALHACSAFITGMIGWLAIYSFYLTNRLRVSPALVAFMAFLLGIAVGTVWEIFEFLADSLLGTNMQKSGLIDTMTDLMINFCGSLLAAGIGYFYVRGGDSLLGRRFIQSILARVNRESAGS